ncbi:uncharacterized protein LOC126278700 [Schistocerca gregaria]|uniref:uncharacterized protein LOC126278700 n=1 Tax=Schistocerca gregaria TaxID=7010 RepID=UPI00211E95F2|nr:uncharacterized protein LOC126278700 [Schistocerca gregaria]
MIITHSGHKTIASYLNQMATMLIKQGHADINALFHGHTPLSWCIVRGNTELLRSLLETNRVDPNKIISEDIGVPLTVVLSEKLTAHIDVDKRLKMCETLLEHGADPLKNIEINDFCGNIMEFAASQFETKEKTTKKGKKDDGKQTDNMKQFMSLLSTAAQSHIIRYLRGKIVIDLLRSVKNNVTPEIPTMAAEAITFSLENVMDCVRVIAKKINIYAEDAIKLLKMFQYADENDSENSYFKIYTSLFSTVFPTQIYRNTYHIGRDSIGTTGPPLKALVISVKCHTLKN